MTQQRGQKLLRMRRSRLTSRDGYCLGLDLIRQDRLVQRLPCWETSEATMTLNLPARQNL
jgi:hypothetical protein